MADVAEFIQCDSRNYTVGRQGNRISKIVMHHTGTEASAHNNLLYFSRSSAKASAHYFIDRDAKIAELEAQITEASKSVESAEALAKQIEGLKAAADEERVGFELKLAGVRNVTAAKAVLGEFGGDVSKLKAAMPWMFEDTPLPGGATGLEPAGAASGGDDELKRWYRIAGIEVEE